MSKFIKYKFKCPNGHIKTVEPEDFGKKQYCYEKGCRIDKKMKGCINVIGMLMEGCGLEKMEKCEYCIETLDDLDWEAPDGSPHHGETAGCGECNAEYYCVYPDEIHTVNLQAEFNYPNLPKI